MMKNYYFTLKFMSELHSIKDLRIKKRIKKILYGIQSNNYRPDILVSLNDNSNVMCESLSSNIDPYMKKKYKLIDSMLVNTYHLDIFIIFQVNNGKYTFLSVCLKYFPHTFIVDKNTTSLMSERYHIMRMFLYESELKNNKLYKLNLSYLKTLSNYNWTPIEQIEISMKEKNDIIKNNVSENEVNRCFIKMLCNNDNFILNKNFDILINNLDSDYKSQAILLKNMVNINSSYYKLSFYVLFPILEHILYKRYKKSSNNYLNKEKILSKIKYMKKHKSLIIANARKFYELRVIGKLYGKGQHTKGKADISYNRNTLVHGKLRIDELSKVRALQLILLCCNVSNDIKDFQ